MANIKKLFSLSSPFDKISVQNLTPTNIDFCLVIIIEIFGILKYTMFNPTNQLLLSIEIIHVLWFGCYNMWV